MHNKRSNIQKIMMILEKIFVVLFLCYCIGVLSTVIERIVYIRGEEAQKLLQYWIVVVVLTLAILLSRKVNKNGSIHEGLFLVFLLSILVRLVVVLSIGIDTNPVSDYKSAYDSALGIYTPNMTGTRKEIIFSNWGMHPVYLKGIMGVLGESVFACILANAIVSSISACLVYSLVFFIKRNKQQAIFSSLLFMLWPSYLLYTIVITPEHINIFLVLISLNLLAYSKWKGNINRRLLYVIYAVSGATLALASFFKSVSIVIIIALLILIVLNFPNYVGEILGAKVRALFIKIGCFIAFYILFIQLGYGILDCYYGREVNRNVTSYYMAVGLNIENNGRYSQEIAKKYEEAIGLEYDFDNADKEMKLVIKKNLSEFPDGWQEFFKTKFKIAWQTDEYTSFIIKTVNNEGKSFINTELWYEHLMGIIHYYYLAVWIMILIGSIKYIRNNYTFWEMFSALFVFGFMCLLLISEAQPRYKCVIYPYMAILASEGMEYFFNILKNVNCKMKGLAEKIVKKEKG